MVGMGSVVTKSVPGFHLAVGNPARSIGCVCRCGQLVCHFDDEYQQGVHQLVCPDCGRCYGLRDRQVAERSVTGKES